MTRLRGEDAEAYVVTAGPFSIGTGVSVQKSESRKRDFTHTI